MQIAWKWQGAMITNGQILFQAVRALTKTSQDAFGMPSDHGRMVMTVEAIAAASPDGEATINDIATEIGLDQSGASRLVSQAMAAGYVARERSAQDGRARICRLTPAGRQLLQDAHRWQDETFAQLTATWEDHEREQFAGYLARVLGDLEKSESEN